MNSFRKKSFKSKHRSKKLKNTLGSGVKTTKKVNISQLGGQPNNTSRAINNEENFIQALNKNDSNERNMINQEINDYLNYNKYHNTIENFIACKPSVDSVKLTLSELDINFSGEITLNDTDIWGSLKGKSIEIGSKEKSPTSKADIIVVVKLTDEIEGKDINFMLYGISLKSGEGRITSSDYWEARAQFLTGLYDLYDHVITETGELSQDYLKIVDNVEQLFGSIHPLNNNSDIYNKYCHIASYLGLVCSGDIEETGDSLDNQIDMAIDNCINGSFPVVKYCVPKDHTFTEMKKMAKDNKKKKNNLQKRSVEIYKELSNKIEDSNKLWKEFHSNDLGKLFIRFLLLECLHGRNKFTDCSLINDKINIGYAHILVQTVSSKVTTIAKILNLYTCIDGDNYPMGNQYLTNYINNSNLYKTAKNVFAAKSASIASCTNGPEIMLGGKKKYITSGGNKTNILDINSDNDIDIMDIDDELNLLHNHIYPVYEDYLIRTWEKLEQNIDFVDFIRNDDDLDLKDILRVINDKFKDLYVDILSHWIATLNYIKPNYFTFLEKIGCDGGTIRKKTVDLNPFMISYEVMLTINDIDNMTENDINKLFITTLQNFLINSFDQYANPDSAQGLDQPEANPRQRGGTNKKFRIIWARFL